MALFKKDKDKQPPYLEKEGIVVRTVLCVEGRGNGISNAATFKQLLLDNGDMLEFQITGRPDKLHFVSEGDTIKYEYHSGKIINCVFNQDCSPSQF